MAFEIERKFLLRGQEWRTLATAQTRVRQAYLAGGDKSSTRVRIKADVAASLTIKASGVGLRRLEVEVPISLIDGEALLSLRQSSLIEKVRHEVPWQRHTWEIDVFAGDNAGLIVAEIELRDEREVFEHPPWLGAEVTGQPRYSTAPWRNTPTRPGGGRPASSAPAEAEKRGGARWRAAQACRPGPAFCQRFRRGPGVADAARVLASRCLRTAPIRATVGEARRQ